MENSTEALRLLVIRRRELEENVIPFVEPGSIIEDMAFDEWFFLRHQMDKLISEAKKIFDK